MTAIECIEISKAFRRVKALSDISLDVEEGEFVIVTGPPSSGKTTLLSVMGGLLHPDNGECYLFGKEIATMSDQERSLFISRTIGTVFQDIHLIDSYTLLENVLFPMQFSNVPTRIARSQSLEILEQMGMAKEKDCYPNEISGGERQLVALARALASEPKVLLLDEPTGYLNHQTAVKVFTNLHQRVMDYALTIVCSCNDIRLHPFAHRVISMGSGKIVNVVGEKSDFNDNMPFMQI